MCCWKSRCTSVALQSGIRVLTNGYGAMEQSQLIEVVRSAVSRLTRWDGDVEQYLLQGAEDAAVRLSVAMETNTLQTVCLPCCEK